MRYVYGSKRMGVYVQVATFVICSKESKAEMTNATKALETTNS